MSMYRKWAKRRNAIMSVALFSMLALPNVGQATDITKADAANNGTVTTEGNVHNVLADKMLDANTALNHFKTFELSPGNIANLFFGTSRDSATAARLLNFVDSGVNIEGIVNAIQNNKIGGDLRFISHEGIAVSKTGVINAGQVGMVVPTKNYYEQLMKNESSLKSADFLSAASIQKGEVPLNIDGSISVAGKINTVDGITLAAAKIELEDGALLNTKNSINYADLVNVKDNNENVTVKAGLTGDLQLTKDEAGDIVLAAVVDSKNTAEASGVKNKLSNWLDKTGANVFRVANWDISDPIMASISMEKDAKIDTAGNVIIAAKAISNNVKPEDADEAAVKDAVKNTKALLGLQASVDLSGTINGQTINVAATTKDDYQFDKDMAKEIKSTSLLSKLKFSGAYMIHKDSAEVKIGKDAKLTAAGEDAAGEADDAGDTSDSTPALSILSSSELNAKLTSEGQVEGKKNQLAAATFSYYKNNANLIIDGSLKADAGSVSAVSDAKTNIAATSSNLASKDDTSHMNFAGNVIIGSTSSQNTLNTGAVLDAAANISVAATLDNSLAIKAENSIKETGLGGSALNFVNTSEKAQVTDSAKITAGGNVDVNAAETNTLRQVTANNGTEKAEAEKDSDKDKEKDQDKDKDTTNAKDAEDDLGLADLFGDAADAAKDEEKEKEDKENKEDKDTETNKTKTSALENAAKYVTVGSSVNVVLGDSKAGVVINKNASISAGEEGALSITAVQSNPDIQIGSIATSAAGSDGKAKSALINAAVSVTNLTNDASVVIAGSDGNNAVSLSGDSITLKAEANSGHGRLDKLVGDIKNIQNVKDKLLSYFTADKWKEPRQHVTDFFTAVGNLKNVAEDPTALQTLVSRGKALYEDLEKNATELEKLGIDVSKTLEAIGNLTNPAKVANYYVDSATRSNMVKNREKNTSAGGSAASVSLAGAVNVVALDDHARVLVGRQAKLDTDGDLTINSGVNKSDIAMNGHLKPSGAAATAVGAVVNVFNSRADSVLAVADKAQLTGGNVSLTGKNNINHYILNGGSGSAANNSNKTGENDTVADTTALQGTVSYVGGESLAIVSVDTGAKITATGETTKADNQKAIDEEWNKLSAEEQKKQKKATAKESGVAEIKAQNDARVLNIAGGLAYGNGSKGIGASVAVTNFDVKTLSAVSDNNTSSNDDIGSLARTIAMRGDANLKSADYFGSAGTKTGAIDAHSLDMNANADGYIHSVSVAGGVIEQTDNGKSGGSLANFVSNTSGKFSSFKEGYQNYFKPDEKQDNGSVFSRTMDRFKQSQEDKDKQETGVANMTGGQTMPSFTLAGAGSVSVNLSANQTKSALRDAKVTLRSNGADAAAFANKASDSLFLGAWSGGAALSFQNIKLKKNTSDSATTVGISGAVAVNKVTSDVLAQVKNSKIQEIDHAQQGSFVNTAEKKGALFAGGVGLTVSQARKNSYNFTGAASTSVNIGSSNVDAQVVNATATTKNISNKAMDTDTQVTGGVNLSIAAGGNGATSAGGTVAFAHLQNKVNAMFDGGTYNVLGNLRNEASASLTQVGGAVGVSVAAPKDGKSYGFQGVAAYNRLENDTKALLKGSATINADAVQNLAQDQASDTTSDYKKYNAALQQADVDVDGDSYTDQLPQNNNEDTKAINEDLAKKGSYGNKIITAAVGLASSKNGSGLAAMAISDVKNDFSAKIENGTITLNNAAQDALKVRAYSNTLDVNTAAGAAVSKSGFGAAGSLSLQFTDNDVTAGVENVKNLSAKGISIEAGTGASEINVAGQVSVSGGAAFGMAMAYNLLNNDTNAYLKDSAINPDLTKFDPGSAMLAVKADSKASVYAVGAGVGISKGLGLNGASAINRGHNSTTAVVENTKANAIKKADVTAADTSKKLAVVGNVQGSGKAAIGGAFVYNDIGSSANHQKTKAAVKNSTLNGVKDQNSDLTVTAKDDSKLTTVGAGVGLSTGAVAVQGVVALTRIQKDVEASIEGANIGSDKSRFAVTTAADTQDNLRTVAAVLSASKNAAIGAGLVMNTDKALTSAQISGGKLYTTGLTIDAKGLSTIHNIAAGGGVAAQGAGIVGSVAINDIQTKNRAVLSGGTEVEASGDSVLITARGDENIKNIVGVLAAAGQGAGVGAAVAKNTIASENYAAVEGANTKVTTSGAKDRKVKDKLNNADQAIVGKLASAAKDKDNKSNAADGEKILDAAANLADLRGESTYKGIAVSASGTHTIKSLLVNAGVAGQGAAINGTFNVNEIGGSTKALVDKAILSTDADANIVARDYTNSYGLVGTVSAAGQGVGAGLGSDSQTITRETTALLTGKKRLTDDVFARNVNVEATGWQGIASHAAGIGFAGMGAGIINGTGVYDLRSQTNASVKNAKVSLWGNFDVLADHHGKIYSDIYSLGLAGAGVGVGTGVAVVKEDSRVKAEVEGTEAGFQVQGTNNQNQAAVKALNDTQLTYELYNIGGGGIGGLAGSIGVANVTGDVTARVADSYMRAVQIGHVVYKSLDPAKIEVLAQNKLGFNNTAFTGALGLGAGVGVGVAINTLDGRVATILEAARLESGEIDIRAKDERNIAQSAYNASAGTVGASANVMITNIGQKLADRYESATNKGKAADGSQVNTSDLLNRANQAVKGNQLQSSTTDGRTGSSTAAAADSGGKSGSGVGITIYDSRLDAKTGSIIFDSGILNNVQQENKSVAIGGAAINGAVGILNNAGKSAINVIVSQADAEKDIKINNELSGANELKIRQGAAALSGAAGIAYAGLNSKTDVTTVLDGALLLASSGLSLNNMDNISTKLDAVGVTLSAGKAGSALLAENSGTGNNAVTLRNTGLLSRNDKDISIYAQSAPKVELSAIAASGSLAFSGTGLSARAGYTSSATVDILHSGITGPKVDIAAINNPQVSNKVGSSAASMIAAMSATRVDNTLGTKDNYARTALNIGDDTRLRAKEVTLISRWNPTQNLELLSLNAGSATVGVTMGNLSSYGTSDVYVEKAGYQQDASLLAIGQGIIEQYGRVGGVTAGGFASGSNFLNVNRDVKTNVFLDGYSNASYDLKNVVASASNFLTQDFKAVGYGAGFATISPWTAVINDNESRAANVILGGKWNLSGTMTALAQNVDSQANLTVDGKNAAVAGLSAVSLTRNTDTDAKVILNPGINVTSKDAQMYYAANEVAVNENVDAAGYGGVNGAGSKLQNKASYRASVETGKTGSGSSSFTVNGSYAGITMDAGTTGSIKARNQLEAGGAASLITAESSHNVAYDNAVKLQNANLKSAGSTSDISLAASDNMTLDLIGVANIQGGLGGKATTINNSVLKRSNTVSLEGSSSVYSGRDVNLFASANSAGEMGELSMQVLADVYNRTAIPVKTKPYYTNSLTQANQVYVGRGSKIETVRDINLKADSGRESIAESAYVYTTYTTKTNNNLITVLPQDKNTREQQSNFITVDGSLLAGLYHALELEITGKAEDGSIKGNVIKGREWFNPQGISFGKQQTVANPYLKEYNELKLAEAQVAASDKTDVKQKYSAELASLLALMEKKGFAIKKGNSYEVLKEAKVAAVTLPAITVSGGNITFSTQSVKGSGSIKAQGADSIVIRDKSNGRLVVNDLTLANAGGQVLLNGADYVAANVQSAKNSQSPVVSIQKTGGSGFGADVHIQGNITNNTGKVQIANNVGDILTTGQISSAYATEISAPKGNYSQTNAGSTQVVGIDPTAPYMFGSEMFAQELYRYFAEKVLGEINRGAAPWLLSGLEDYDNYLKTTAQDVFNRLKKTESGRAEVQKILGSYYDPKASQLSAQAIAYLKSKYTSATPEGSIVAGGDVSIAAKNIIVNGLIQSGYNTYRTDIDTAKVAALDKKVTANQKLTDSDVLGNREFLVNKTDAAQLWNAGQSVFEGVINTYYNPYTGHLLTEDTYVKGGNIHLQGNVVSTIAGTGRILAAKGAADISVDAANLNKDLYVGAITNNYRNGNIFINGKQQTGNSYQLNSTEPTRERYVLRWTLSAEPVTNIQNFNYKVEKNAHNKTIDSYGKAKALERFEQSVISPGMTIDKNKLERIGPGLTTKNTVAQVKSVVSNYLISLQHMDRPTNHMPQLFAAYANNPPSVTNPADPRATEENYKYNPFKDDWRIYNYSRIYTLSPTVDALINFDKPIKTGTLNMVNGNITLKGGGNVVLTGDIKSAVKDGKNLGSVDISSASGAIENNNVRVTTDNLTVKAPKGIELNVAGNTLVYGNSKNGDITIKAADSLQLGAFNLGADESTLSLSARGNITMADKERIKAQNVKLVSKEGGIGSQNSFVKTYTSSTNRIDAEAKGNIYIQTDNGNMGVGTIKSTGGDVTLSATQGSIVDAKSSGIQLSDSQKKVNKWLELGLISAQDADDSMTAAAAAEKAERLAGLEGRLQTLGAASGRTMADYISIAKAFAKDSTVLARKAAFEKQAQNIDDDAAYANLFNSYRAELLSWFTKNYQGLSEAERAVVMDYGLLEASNDYGFSKNQLLYAIQSDIVNSAPGQTVVISSPNIHAKNVTLLAGNDIGYKTRKVSIQAADLNKVENLKLLASVKAGDLTWNEDGSVDVRQRVPVSLDLREGGTITLGKKTRNIFLAGTENTTFNFTSGFGSEISDIVLMTGNGIYLPKNEADRIYAKDLTVYAGRGDIGSLDNYLRTKITGSLEANAGGSIFIDNLGDLTIVSAIAGADRRSVLVGTNKTQPIASGETSGLFLKTTGAMHMSTERGKDMGYLRGNSINLEAAQLGTEDNPLRIYANGAVLNLAYGDAWLKAVGNGETLWINQYKLNSVSLSNPDRFIWMLDRSDARYKDIYEFYHIYDERNTLDDDKFLEDKETENLVITDQEREKVVENNNNRSQELVIRNDAGMVRITEKS